MQNADLAGDGSKSIIFENVDRSDDEGNLGDNSEDEETKLTGNISVSKKHINSMLPGFKRRKPFVNY